MFETPENNGLRARQNTPSQPFWGESMPTPSQSVWDRALPTPSQSVWERAEPTPSQSAWDGDTTTPPPPPATGETGRSRWHWLLVVAVVVPLLTPLYNRVQPQLFGLPFFYWSQMAFVVLAALTTAVVYQATKKRRGR